DNRSARLHAHGRAKKRHSASAESGSCCTELLNRSCLQPLRRLEWDGITKYVALECGDVTPLLLLFISNRNQSGVTSPHSKKEKQRGREGAALKRGALRGRAKRGVGLGVGLMAVLLLGFAGCSAPPSPWPADKSPKVLPSFPPLYCFAKNVATNDAHV